MSVLWQHLALVGGLLLGILSTVRLVRERRSPSTVFAWLFLILAVPYVGLVLYWALGGRRLLRWSDPGGDPDAPSRVLRTEGNSVRLLGTPQEAWEGIRSTLEAARRSIRIEVFILGDDEIGASVAEILARRAREGVEVRLLLDALGSFGARRRFAADLRRAGVRVAAFHPLLPRTRRWSLNLRNHRKVVIADGAVAIVGGMNLADDYMGADDGRDRWIDLTMRVEGPAVGTLAHLFADDWEYATREALAPEEPRAASGTEDLELVATGPASGEQTLRDRILLAVARAHRRVRIVTPYFVPDEAVLSLLASLAREGKQVEVILPQRSNHRLADLARGRPLRDLHDAGVRILLHPERMIHAKLMVIDDAMTYVGSANLDLRSLYLNFEVGLLLRSPGANAAALSWLADLEGACRPFEPGRPTGPRAIAESAAAFVSPLL